MDIGDRKFIVHARGMAQIAKDAGIARHTLYKSLGLSLVVKA